MRLACQRSPCVDCCQCCPYHAPAYPSLLPANLCDLLLATESTYGMMLDCQCCSFINFVASAPLPCSRLLSPHILLHGE